ncbi:hypothetical protein [Dactylosporangium sp. CA-092794]|uniref:hypothetical protein n=1 Tax=Dactylosporangium sp. CA-092794 TaxID=3239929 RepID=UPI003D92EE28
MKRARPLIALAVALAVGGWLLAARPATPRTPPGSPTATAAPAAKLPTPHSMPAKLTDGAEYTPLFYVDATTAVGTAPTPDGSADRLILRSSTGDRELRRFPQDRYAQFLGFTASAGTLYWAESAATQAGPYETRLWRAPLDGSAPPASLTANTGAAVFFDSEYDLVIADNRVNWVAADPDNSQRTELRSVPITGGPVTTKAFDGRFRHTTWPWLLSVDDQAPLQLANPLTGERRTVSRAAAESVVCTPEWCRSMVLGAGRSLFDARHPDGSARRRIPGDLTAVTVDTAIAGHYEIFTQLSGDRVALVAYDLTTSTIQPLAADTGVTSARAGVVWWADRPANPTTWNAIDLRATPTAG